MAYSVTTVKAAQQNINNMGYSPALVVDGKEGPKTDAGVVWARNNGASVDGESNSLAKLTDGFLLAIGVTPTGVTATAGSAPQNVKPAQGGGGTLFFGPPPVVPGPLASSVSFGPSPTPTPGPSFGPPLNVKPPLPAPAPAPVKPPPAAPSPIPAAIGAGAGAGIGWFGFGGPIAALIGAAAGGIAGWIGGKKLNPTMGCEMGAEPSPTTLHFRAKVTDLAHKPAHFYRYAPKTVVDAFAQWAANIVHLPPNAMRVPIKRFGVWEAHLSGPMVLVYGPPFKKSFGPRAA